MAREYVSPAAVCPHYRMEDSAQGVAIWCRGVSGAVTLRLLYADGAGCTAQKRAFCRGDWQRCPLARLMEEEIRRAGMRG